MSTHTHDTRPCIWYISYVLLFRSLSSYSASESPSGDGGRRVAQNCEEQLLASSCPSAWSNSVLAAWIFAKFGEYFSEKNKYLSRKFNVSSEYDKNDGYFTCRLMYIYDVSRWILLIMRNVSDKEVDKIKTRILCSVAFFRKSCHLWDNVEKYCRAGQATDDSIIRRMRIACWIPKATNIHSECVILVSLDTATVVARKHVTVKLQVHCLSCYFIHCLLIDHEIHRFDIDLFVNCNWVDNWWQ